MMAEAAETRRKQMQVDQALRRRTFEQLPAGGLAVRTRAMLKVQDGCSNFCTYCIIPFARGPVRSLPLADAVRQTRELVREGYREIVVTGIEIASWGADLPGNETLTDLLEAVLQAAPDTRIRLGSLERGSSPKISAGGWKALPTSARSSICRFSPAAMRCCSG